MCQCGGTNVSGRGRLIGVAQGTGCSGRTAGHHHHHHPLLQVFHALSTASGGSPAASLEEVVARLARSKLARGYPSAREALLVNGKFILAQVGGCVFLGGRCVCVFGEGGGGGGARPGAGGRV